MKTKLLLTLVLILSLVEINAQEFTDNNIRYNITSSVSPYTVEIVGNSFLNTYTGNVTIPATVTYNSVSYSVKSIQKYAFSGNYFSSIDIPASIIFIDQTAFYICSFLLHVDANNPNYSSIDGVLYNKDQTTLMNFPNHKTGDFVIPSSVVLINDGAFDTNNLTTITIPASVNSVGIGAFQDSPAIFIVDNNNPNYSSIDGVLYNKTQTTLIQYPTSKTGSFDVPSSVSKIGYAAFAYCPNLTSITLPPSVTSIEKRAFHYCTGLTSILLPATLSTIEADVFSGCSSLTSVVIPSSVTSIGEWAFSSSGLTTITIPKLVTSIGSLAFFGCVGLTAIYVENSTPADLSACQDVFYNVNKTTCILYVPIGSRSLYAAADQWKDFTNIVERNMTSIDNKKISQIALFPNPATSSFAVEGLVNSATVAVFDIAGKKVAEQTVQPSEKISVAGWNKGLYLVKANGKTTKLTVK